MPTNVTQFNDAVILVSKDLTVRQTIALQKKIALEALRRIVQKTPVKTGRARGNWQTTINESPEGERETSSPIGDGLAVLKGLGSFQVVFITNNVPYILALENGSSKQAPQGMVAVTLEELITLFPG